jgi:TPR repeat protein
MMRDRDGINKREIHPGMEALRSLADGGAANAENHYGACLVCGDGISINKSLAVHYFKLSADHGNADSHFNYGLVLAHGDGILMNKSLAVHYFKLSADQGGMHMVNSCMVTCLRKVMKFRRTNHLLFIISNCQQIKEMQMVNSIMV